MIKVNTITQAVEEMFNTDPEFNRFTIERSDWVNENPSVCPWIGIYRGDMQYNPETLGDGPDYWTGLMNLRLVVQSANYESGAAAEDELEDNVEIVISKILSDTTLRGVIDMVNEINVNYTYLAENDQTMFYQAALIEMKLEVSTS